MCTLDTTHAESKQNYCTRTELSTLCFALIDSLTMLWCCLVGSISWFCYKSTNLTIYQKTILLDMLHVTLYFWKFRYFLYRPLYIYEECETLFTFRN